METELNIINPNIEFEKKIERSIGLNSILNSPLKSAMLSRHIVCEVVRVSNYASLIFYTLIITIISSARFRAGNVNPPD